MSEPDPGVEPVAEPRRLPRNVKLLGLASCLNDVASEIIFPLMPVFLTVALGGSAAHLGLIEGLAKTISSLLSPVVGSWSDTSRRRKAFVVIGYGLATIARPVIALATTPWLALAARSADRVGKGIRTAPRDALIADSTPPAQHGRAFGFHRAMDHLGAAVGPLIAAAWLFAWPDGMRSLFLVTLVPGVAVVILLAVALREPEAASPPKMRPKLTLKPFGRGFRVYLLALAVFTLGFATEAFFLLRMYQIGTSAVLIALLWAAYHLVKSSVAWFAGGLSDRVGPRRLIVGGWIAYAAVALSFGLIETQGVVWGLFMIHGACVAVTEPAEKAYVGRLAGDEYRGLAFGWFNLTLGLGALPAGIAFGLLYAGVGPLVAFGWSAVMALLAAAVLGPERDLGEPGAASKSS